MDTLTDIDALIDLDRRAIALAGLVAGMTAAELTARGMEADRAEQFVTVATTFYGPTSHSAYQRRCRDKALENGHRLDTLAYIARASRTITDPTERWRFREALCATSGDGAEVRRQARALKRTPTPPPAHGYRVARYADGTMRLSFVGPSAQLQDVVDSMEADAQSDSLFDATAWLLSRKPVAETTAVANVVLTVTDYFRILTGDGDDIRVEMSNGAVLTGAELLERKLQGNGYITLVSPMEGPLNTYRARFAHDKHRRMIDTDGARCCWPDCRAPAAKAQAHHIHEYRDGGETHAGNLCWLCSFHNGVNGLPQFGRVERRAGRIVWISPGGHVVPTGRAYSAVDGEPPPTSP